MVPETGLSNVAPFLLKILVLIRLFTTMNVILGVLSAPRYNCSSLLLSLTTSFECTNSICPSPEKILKVFQNFQSKISMKTY